MGYSLIVTGSVTDPRDERAIYALARRVADEAQRLDREVSVIWTGDHTGTINTIAERVEAEEAEAKAREERNRQEEERIATEAQLRQGQRGSDDPPEPQEGESEADLNPAQGTDMATTPQETPDNKGMVRPGDLEGLSDGREQVTPDSEAGVSEISRGSRAPRKAPAAKKSKAERTEETARDKRAEVEHAERDID